MNLLLDWLLKFLFLYTGLTTSLFSMSWLGSQGASFYARILTSYACLVICSVYGFLAALFLRLFGLHRISQWATARAFKYTMRFSTGVRFKVISGKQHLSTRPCVIVGNHQTALDVLLLGEIFPRFCSVTAKKSLARAPFLGWFMSLSGTVFIDRKERTAALKAFGDAAEEMRRQRQSVFIFPEGTRSYAEEAKLLEFKKGAFHLAIQAGVPVVPVITCNYNGILNAKAKLFRRGEIPVIVLPPIPTTNLTPSDAEDLTRYVRNLMLRELIRLSESPRGQRAARPPGWNRPYPAKVASSTTSATPSRRKSSQHHLPGSSPLANAASLAEDAKSETTLVEPTLDSATVEYVKNSEVKDTGVADGSQVEEMISPMKLGGRKESDMRKGAVMGEMMRSGKGEMLERGDGG